jgi:glycosyltransferase involved in cell wall biosynthesis
MLLPWLELGGADRCNLDIIRHLVERGWHVCVIATLEARHAWQERFRVLTDDLLIPPHLIPAERATTFVLDRLERQRPDLLFSSNCRLAYDILPIIKATFPALPVVVLNHMEEPWGQGGYPGLAARAGALVDRHWVVSDHLRDWLLARGVAPARVRTLHWYVDTSYWSPCVDSRQQFRQRLGIPEQMPVIVFAGRLCRQKRPDRLASSLRTLAESGQEFVLLVAGDGELAPELHRSVQQMGLGQRVHFLGWQDEVDLRSVFRAADLLFLPSEAEGIALVLFEAMACGLAVVASSVGGQVELVSAECGRLIAPKDEKGHAIALQELLADSPKLREMGEAARSRILQGFSELSFARRLEALLADVELQPWSHLPLTARPPWLALVRLQWQWSVYRLLVRFQLEQLVSVPLIGRPLSMMLKAALYTAVWGIGICRWRRRSTP